jgi:hypothetical protein
MRFFGEILVSDTNDDSLIIDVFLSTDEGMLFGNPYEIPVFFIMILQINQVNPVDEFMVFEIYWENVISVIDGNIRFNGPETLGDYKKFLISLKYGIKNSDCPVGKIEKIVRMINTAVRNP